MEGGETPLGPYESGGFFEGVPSEKGGKKVVGREDGG